MDDFERELTRMMHDSRRPASFESGQRDRLYKGIRVRHRSRVLWRAGGSALAVAGLSIGLALLPGAGSRSLPADRPPLPVTGPTPSRSSPPASPPAGTSFPSASYPPTHTSGTTETDDGDTPTFPPSRTPDASTSATFAPSAPVSTDPPVTPPSTEGTGGSSMTAGGG
ncbi:cellulase [Streptomyces sp. CHD11]|uniref:cellulase n=1 Tax=Streptomyces sp. CHD11 TaxID=2741325 RepID=UPI001BFC8404|nr:cellulase [Streptomyces sp. CHD11]MBT3152500.1 cellulase [Streptomyces sp. CHD11]